MATDTLGPVGRLLSDESKWTKGTYARNAAGEPVASYADEAACWCLIGAYLRCWDCNDAFIEVERALEGIGYRCGVAHWNDSPDRTFADVQELLRKTGI